MSLTPTASVRYTPMPAPPTSTPEPVPSRTRAPGAAVLEIRLTDASGARLSWQRFGPQVFVYPAKSATCAYFRSGLGAGTANDNLVVAWDHVGPNGSATFEVPSPGSYLVYGGSHGRWWKNKPSCEAADTLQLTTDTTVDLVD